MFSSSVGFSTKFKENQVNDGWNKWNYLIRVQAFNFTFFFLGFSFIFCLKHENIFRFMFSAKMEVKWLHDKVIFEKLVSFVYNENDTVANTNFSVFLNCLSTFYLLQQYFIQFLSISNIALHFIDLAESAVCGIELLFRPEICAKFNDIRSVSVKLLTQTQS